MARAVAVHSAVVVTPVRRRQTAVPQPASCAEHGSQCICLAVFPTEAALWVAEAIIYGLSFA